MSLTFRISPSRCVECMACVRVCPVEAVQVQDGAVAIDEGSCIECGLCVPACPHDAIDGTGDIELARSFLDRGSARLILATESYVHFHPALPDQLVNACYAAGFGAVYPGVLGDELVAREYLKLWESGDYQTTIRSTSPIVVEYVQREYPELLPYLAPVATPAVAQARYLRAEDEDAPIVYCGIASPGTTEEVPDAIDAAITFQELDLLLTERDANPLEQPVMPAQQTPDRRRHLSVAGGMPLPVLTAERSLSRRFRVVRGLEGVAALADAIERADGAGVGFVDLLPYEGDLGHPAMGPSEELYRRREIAEQAEPPRAPDPVIDSDVEVDLFVDRRPIGNGGAVTDEEIEALIDEEIGRAANGSYWDCGGCGAPGCREFARAVIRGRARLDICPYYQARRYEEAVKDAAHDALTELYSYRVLRSRLMEEVGRVDRSGEPAAILFLDIDEFKPVNDRFGHHVGNQVLRDVADVIRSSIRRNDFAARFGGDEFVVIVVDGGHSGAERVAAEIHDKASRITAQDEEGNEMPISVSVGISEIWPEDARNRDPDEILAAADAALLRAKREGGDSIRFYTEQPDES